MFSLIWHVNFLASRVAPVNRFLLAQYHYPAVPRNCFPAAEFLYARGLLSFYSIYSLTLLLCDVLPRFALAVFRAV
jgi:hypothetical protein